MNRNQDLYRYLQELHKLTDSMLSELHGYKSESVEHFTNQTMRLRKLISEECTRRNTGEEAGEYMSDFVNCMAMRKEEDEFVDKVVNGIHRTLNQSLIGLFIKVLIAEGKCTRYDGRNEASVKACEKLLPQLEEVYLPFI